MLKSRKPSFLRIFTVLTGIIVVNVPIFITARSIANQSSTNVIVFSSLAGVISAFLIATIVEWSVHRYAMHKGNRLPLIRIVTELHHKAHHWVHVPPDRYLHSGQINRPSVFAANKTKLCQTTLTRILTTASHAAFYSLLTAPIILFAWLATANIWFTALMATAAAVFIYLCGLRDAGRSSSSNAAKAASFFVLRVSSFLILLISHKGSVACWY